MWLLTHVVDDESPFKDIIAPLMEAGATGSGGNDDSRRHLIRDFKVKITGTDPFLATPTSSMRVYGQPSFRFGRKFQDLLTVPNNTRRSIRERSLTRGSSAPTIVPVCDARKLSRTKPAFTDAAAAAEEANRSSTSATGFHSYYSAISVVSGQDAEAAANTVQGGASIIQHEDMNAV
jgi:hypothetical protein